MPFRCAVHISLSNCHISEIPWENFLRCSKLEHTAWRIAIRSPAFVGAASTGEYQPRAPLKHAEAVSQAKIIGAAAIRHAVGGARPLIGSFRTVQVVTGAVIGVGEQ